MDLNHLFKIHGYINIMLMNFITKNFISMKFPTRANNRLVINKNHIRLEVPYKKCLIVNYPHYPVFP